MINKVEQRKYPVYYKEKNKTKVLQLNCFDNSGFSAFHFRLEILAIFFADFSRNFGNFLKIVEIKYIIYR